MIYEVTVDGKRYRLELRRENGSWHCKLDGSEIQFDVAPCGHDLLSLLVGGKSYEVRRDRSANSTRLWIAHIHYEVDVRDPKSLRNRRSGSADQSGAKNLVAPMPGKVVRILAHEKTRVELGQGVLVVEAMKMQNEIKSPKKGILQKLLISEGASVNAGEVLAVVE
jgi:biotin carboxyl carrier protein